MSGIVAIVGRPNVGKSTLFNRLIERKEAIVDEVSGVTRDRHYGKSDWNGVEFSVIDTGGYLPASDDVFQKEIDKQVILAIDEADVILFLVDVKDGLTGVDQSIADLLHKSSKETLLLVNKVDNSKLIDDSNEFYSLGFENLFCLSSINGSGTGEFLDLLAKKLPKEDLIVSDVPKFAVVGRPNAGKSSFINSLIGKDRFIVTDVAGTTRDSLYTRYNQFGFEFELIDTAGIRRKKNVKYGTEFFGINRSFKSIDRSDICLLVLDAEDGVTEQDQKLAGRIEEQGKSCLIVINKWDLIEKDSSTIYSAEKKFRSKLYFLNWSKMIFISALTGKRVNDIFENAKSAIDQHRRRVSTSVVNEVIKEAITWRSPPTKRSGKQGRIYYGTQVKNQPPTFSLFVNDPKLFGSTYRRYIEKQFRMNLGFEGTPLIFLWRGKQRRSLDRDISKNNIEVIQDYQ